MDNSLLLGHIVLCEIDVNHKDLCSTSFCYRVQVMMGSLAVNSKACWCASVLGMHSGTVTYFLGRCCVFFVFLFLWCHIKQDIDYHGHCHSLKWSLPQLRGLQKLLPAVEMGNHPRERVNIVCLGYDALNHIRTLSPVSGEGVPATECGHWNGRGIALRHGQVQWADQLWFHPECLTGDADGRGLLWGHARWLQGCLWGHGALALPA